MALVSTQLAPTPMTNEFELWNDFYSFPFDMSEPNNNSTPSNNITPGNGITPRNDITPSPSAKPETQMPSYKTSSERWLAVSRRDPAAASSFVYAVTTTKIYCRPTCPARLARRANVTFFATAQDAAAHGFRACKRCKPDVPAGAADDEQCSAGHKVRRAAEVVLGAAGRGERVGLRQLGAEVGLSRWHLQRVFKRTHGVTPQELGRACLVEPPGATAAARRSPDAVSAGSESVAGDVPARSAASGSVVGDVPALAGSGSASPAAWSSATADVATPPLFMDDVEGDWWMGSGAVGEPWDASGQWVNMFNADDAQVEKALRDLFPELY